MLVFDGTSFFFFCVFFFVWFSKPTSLFEQDGAKRWKRKGEEEVCRGFGSVLFFLSSHNTQQNKKQKTKTKQNKKIK